ncbi:hypothetical protein D9619_008255 [Psilocybe cf. subviscida]|uniref:Uncharacterized protein n=1 Tax=Psilocybe cf. subviscida TaxID=2480587 RepID=A0A8H5ATX8_9AGAR|nr:hypothetical protein D9619_008255 [Psilocybe cf. subviscida]
MSRDLRYASYERCADATARAESTWSNRSSRRRNHPPLLMGLGVVHSTRAEAYTPSAISSSERGKDFVAPSPSPQKACRKCGSNPRPFSISVADESMLGPAQSRVSFVADKPLASFRSTGRTCVFCVTGGQGVSQPNIS